MTPAEQLAAWMRDSRFTVVFTGAGMSTESGLPDFRSAGGLWKQNRRFEELASVEALDGDYEEFAEFYRWRIQQLGNYRPHRGHERLADWQQRGLVHALITQNVDGFHERAGSAAPMNLHGTLSRVACRDCGAEQDASRFLVETKCDCGGKLRPAVVLFGEALPEETLIRAMKASERASLFVVLGSSLLVSPANGLPLLAKRRGGKLAIVNRDPTPLDEYADLTLAEAIGPTLDAVDAALQARQ
jgi:NAD-dependent deacetylase